MYTYQRYDHPPTANRLRQTDVLLMVSDDKSRQNDPKRVMFVVSATHAADSRVGAIWDDQNPSFALMDSLLRHAGLSFNDFPFLTVNWDAYCYTQDAAKGGLPGLQESDMAEDLMAELYEAATASSLSRVLRLIELFKPSDIVVLGIAATRALLPYCTLPYKDKMLPSNAVGISVPVEFPTDTPTQAKLWCLPDPVELLFSKAATRACNLFGWISRVLHEVVTDIGYKLPDGFADQIELGYVDTMDKFWALTEKIKDAPCVSIDTEGPNLNRIATSLDIIQFAVDTKVGYVLPLRHYDSPFTIAEQDVIAEWLAKWFWDNQNSYHIYHNASHDLPVLMSQLKFGHNCADIWDLMAGEYALDENMSELTIYLTTLNGKKGGGYHNLANLTWQYGCPVYSMGEFGKESRVGIHAMPLNTPGLLMYCAYDVVLPFAIHQLQRQRAYARGYYGFDLVTRVTISDQINMFGKMHLMGELIDVDELFSLNMPNSEIQNLIRDEEQDLRESDEVQQAVARIYKDNKKDKTSSWMDDDDVGVATLTQDRQFDFGRREHLAVLFNDVMQIHSDETTDAGDESFGKSFKNAFGDNPVVKRWSDLIKAKKLHSAFLAPLLAKATTNPDCQMTGRVRSTYSFVRVLTGRVASVDPNMQQIPQHSAIAKLVKNAFMAPKGTLFFKVDYSAHELRCWSIIAFCADLAARFQVGLDLIAEFRRNPTVELAKRIATEGDIHRQNAAMFFNMDINAIDSATRTAIKGVSFGAIFGRMVENIAKAIGLPLEMVQKVYDAFFAMLPRAANWLHGVETKAQENLFTESPLHRRRNLFGYLGSMLDFKGLRGISNALNRRARNSPIQGMGSDLGFTGARLLERLVWFLCRDDSGTPMENLPIRTCNMVHDSNEMEVEYLWVLPALSLIEYALTTGNQWKAENIYGTEFMVGMAIEIEIGPRLSKMSKWAPEAKPVFKLDADGKPVKPIGEDGKPGKPEVIGYELKGDFAHLHDIILKSLEFQRDKQGYDVDVDATMAAIFNPEFTPGFLLAQADRLPDGLADKYGYTAYGKEPRSFFNHDLKDHQEAGVFDELLSRYPKYADVYGQYEATRRQDVYVFPGRL